MYLLLLIKQMKQGLILHWLQTARVTKSQVSGCVSGTAQSSPAVEHCSLNEGVAAFPNMSRQLLKLDRSPSEMLSSSCAKSLAVGGEKGSGHTQPECPILMMILSWRGATRASLSQWSKAEQELPNMPVLPLTAIFLFMSSFLKKTCGSLSQLLVFSSL